MENKKLLNVVKKYIYKQYRKSIIMEEYLAPEIKERIEENIKSIYTNEFDSNTTGKYELDDSIIRICRGNPKGPLMTLKDILKNNLTREILIHECTHAILYDKENSRMGLLFWEKNKQEGSQDWIYSYKEIGRGLNEGYTNYILKKMGIHINSYKILTNIATQIGEYIGTKKMMHLSRENLDEIYKELNMSKIEGQEFFRSCDEIYTCEMEELYLKEIKEYINIKIKNVIETESREQDIKKIEQEQKFLKRVERQTRFRQILPYQTRSRLRKLQANGQIEELLQEYEIISKNIDEHISNNNKALKEIVLNVEDMVISKILGGKLAIPKTEEMTQSIIEIVSSIEQTVNLIGEKSPAVERMKEELNHQLIKIRVNKRLPKTLKENFISKIFRKVNRVKETINWNIKKVKNKKIKEQEEKSKTNKIVYRKKDREKRKLQQNIKIKTISQNSGIKENQNKNKSDDEKNDIEYDDKY